MPNIKSAKKRVLIAKVNNERNKADKSALKTTLKKFEAAVTEGNRERPIALTRLRFSPSTRLPARVFFIRMLPPARRARSH